MEDLMTLPIREAEDAFVRRYLREKMEEANGRLEVAASLSGMKPTTFYMRCQRLEVFGDGPVAAGWHREREQLSP